MLVQPQQAATECELDLVGSTPSGHGNGLRPGIRNNDRRTAPEPLNLTLDLEQAHVSGRSTDLPSSFVIPAKAGRRGGRPAHVKTRARLLGIGPAQTTNSSRLRHLVLTWML